MAAYINLSTFALTIDAAGVSETRPMPCPFGQDPVILGGDTLVNSPAPTLTQATVSGEPSLTLGSPALSGSTWTVPVSVTGGVPDNVVLVCCRAKTTAGYTITAQVNVILAGPG